MPLTSQSNMLLSDSLLRLQDYRGDPEDQEQYQVWQQRRSQAEAAGYCAPEPGVAQARVQQAFSLP